MLIDMASSVLGATAASVTFSLVQKTGTCVGSSVTLLCDLVAKGLPTAPSHAVSAVGLATGLSLRAASETAAMSAAVLVGFGA